MTRRSLLLPLALLSGCLLPTPPPPPRLFAPVTSPAAPHVAGTVAVRFRPVRGPLHLREAITWRRNEAEYGTYEQRRWTEQPSTYVARAVEDALAAAGVTVVGGDDAPALAVELLHFEEVLAPSHEAVVEIEAELTAAGHVTLKRRFAAREAITGDDPPEVARAVGRALDQVAADAASAVRDAAAGRSQSRNARRH